MGTAIELKPIQKMIVRFGIRGTSPMIQHKWSEKNKDQLREKHQGKKTKDRSARDPDQEAKDATYVTVDGHVGLPLMAFKKSLITAAHKDLGIEKTLVRKSVFLKAVDANLVAPIEFDEMVIREDTVRVGQGSADLRYRPEFRGWRCVIEAELDSELMTLEAFATLVNRAGFGVGLGEWRPEKEGEYGRFEIDDTVPMEQIG